MPNGTIKVIKIRGDLMGSFNMVCSISDLTIHYNDDIVFFPIVSSNLLYDLKAKPMELSATGYYSDTTNLFRPYSMPIYCKYADYGLIKDVMPSENVSLLEKEFQLDVPSIVKGITSERSVYDLRNSMFEPKIKQELKDVLSNPLENENLDNLLHYGFVKEAYGYSHSTIVGLTVVIKEKVPFIGVRYLDKEVENLARVGSVLVIASKLTGIYLGIEESEVERIRLFEKLSGMFVHREVYEEMKKNWDEELYSFNPHPNDSLEKYLAAVQEEIDDPDSVPTPLFSPKNPKMAVRFDSIERLKRTIPDYTRYMPLIENSKEFREEVVGFIFFLRNMYKTNKMFKPAMYGEQGGNFEATKRLLELSIKINEKK